MPKQYRLNQTYAAHYSAEFAGRVCGEFFASNETISGKEIVELTACRQLNLLVIKGLFERWQEQLEQLSQVPFFDYADETVQAALQEFMNSLSRAIKIQRADFEPLLAHSLEKTLLLAVEPERFMEEVFQALTQKSTLDFSPVRKYIKWHVDAWRPAMELLSDSPESPAWRDLLEEGFGNRLEAALPGDLLGPLNETLPIDQNQLVHRLEMGDEGKLGHAEARAENANPAEEQVASGKVAEADPDPSSSFIDPALAWARFESEEYAYMKGSIGHLREGMGINQRIMFTKRLFQGNQDLLDQALEELDQTESFFDAVNLLNTSFVATLKWDVQSDEVQELLQLVFRKFDGD